MYKDNKIKRNKVVSLVKVQNTFWWFVNRLPLKWWEQQIDILFFYLQNVWSSSESLEVNSVYTATMKITVEKLELSKINGNRYENDWWLMMKVVFCTLTENIVRSHKRWWFETVIVELTAICALCFVLISPTLAWRIGNAEIRSFPPKNNVIDLKKTGC